MTPEFADYEFADYKNLRTIAEQGESSKSRKWHHVFGTSDRTKIGISIGETHHVDFVPAPFHIEAKVSATEFLESIARIRRGEIQRREWMVAGKSYGDVQAKVTLENGRVGVEPIAKREYGSQWPLLPSIDLRSQWDLFFLDLHSVLEDQEDRRRNPRLVTLSVVEKALLDEVSANPELLHHMDDRGFEVFVATALTNAGFSGVNLSRFCRDGGIDVWAVRCVGDKEYVVVVEAKHYNGRAVGIEIVDRLDGVRDAVGASHGIVATNSSFSLDARKRYGAKLSRVSLFDFDKLRDLLNGSVGWTVGPSGILTPTHHIVEATD